MSDDRSNENQNPPQDPNLEAPADGGAGYQTPAQAASDSTVTKPLPGIASPAVLQTIIDNPSTERTLGFMFDGAKKVTDQRRRPMPPPVVSTAQSSFQPDFASSTVEGPPSIVELARALNVNSNGPQLMYEWVYNNVDWEPGWGVYKGALGALLDNAGNSFDQSLLLANLLRQAGFTANIVQGSIRLTEAQYTAWFGTSDIWAAQNYCFNLFIPVVTAPTWTGSNYYMDIKHVWVQWVDGATTYVFDPTLKAYNRAATIALGGTVTSGDVLTIIVYNAALSGGSQSVSYTTTGSDTLYTIAAALSNAINSNSSLAAIGVVAGATASPIPAQVTVSPGSPSINQTTFGFSTNVGATETLTSTTPVSILGNILNYNATNFLNDAESGATIDVSGNYVQNMNRTNIRADLQTLTSTMSSYIKSNTVGAAVAGAATVDDLLGGQSIVPATIPLLQTSLPYEMPGDSPTIWTGDVPSTFKPTLQVQFPNWSNPNIWDFTWSTTSDQLAATRLTLFYNSLVPSLYLNGTAVATGLVQPSGSWTSIYITVTQPAYAATNYPLSSQQYYQTNYQWWQSFIYAGGSYLVGNAWGNLGRGQLDFHQIQAAANIAAGGSSSSESVMGETLAYTFFVWAAQNSRVCDLVNRMKACRSVFSHQIGVISCITGSPTVSGIDLGGVSGSSDNLNNDVTQTPINDTVIAMHGVALEAAALEQVGGVPPGISMTTLLDRINRSATVTVGGTVTVGDILTISIHDSALSGGVKSDSYTVITGDSLNSIAIGLATALNADSSLSAIGVTAITSGAEVIISSASANQTSYSASTSSGATETLTIAFEKIYKGTSSNWNTGANISTTLVANGYSSTDMTNLYNWYLQYGNSVIIGDNPSTTLGSFNGWGYWNYPVPNGAFGITNGVFKDGHIKGPPTTPPINKTPPTIPPRKDPIDTATGAFLYNKIDLSIGSQDIPYRLAFSRSYSSQQQYVGGPLGWGWTHNHAITASVGSDGLQGMGWNFALPGAACIAELYVATDLFSDSTRPVAKLVTTSLADDWWIDQIVSNTVVLANAGSGNVFVKQPDGSYTAPSNFPGTLTLTSGLYTYTSPQGIKQNFNSAGQISTIVYPNGMTVTYTYTSGVLTSISNGLTRTLTLSYTGGKLTSVSDGTGRSVSYTLDSNSDLTQVSDANSKTYNFSYDQPGRMTQVFKPNSATVAMVTNTFDSLSRVKTQQNARSQQYTYYFAGSRSEEQDPLSNSTVWYFNRGGYLTRFINALGFETDSSFDGLNRLIYKTLPEGNQFRYTYDSNNNVLSITAVPKSGSGLSNITNTFTYDPTWAKLKTKVDGLSQTTTLSYDASTGNLLNIYQPMVGGFTPTTTFTYNGRGQVLTAQDASGVKTQFTYDTTTEKLLTTVIDPGTTPHLALTTSFGYDSVGNVTSVTNPNSNQTTMQYDSLRRRTQVTAPTPFSYVTNFAYDNNSNLLTVQRQTAGIPAWQTFSYTYSSTDKVLTTVDPANKTTTLTYDGKDRLATSTDAQSRQYQFAYDALDRLNQVTDPTSTVSSLKTFSNNGLLATIKDANTNQTQFSYDGLDRPNKTTYADTTYTQNLSYDANGNVLVFVTRAGTSYEITNTFDPLNRLSTKTPSGQPQVTYTYDLSGRLLDASKPVVSGDPSSGALQNFFDTAGRFYQEEYPDGKTITHVLDANGNRTKTTWPDSYYVTRDFDQLDRLSDIKLNGSSTAAAQFSYNQLSQRTQITFGNGATVVYAPEPNGDLASITHNFVGSSATFSYGFNNVNEMTSQQVSDSSFNWHPSAAGTITYAAADSVNRYGTVGGASYSYNGNSCLTGDGTWTYTYDTENHLLTASKTGTSASGVYDPIHRQSQKTVGSVLSRYIYSGWQRIADYDGSTGLLQNRYVYGTGLDQSLIQVSSAGVLTFYHHDRMGSVVAVSNASGAVANKNLFGPFGEIASLAGTTFGFTGQRYDSELGLYYYKFRYYSPMIGRFLQPDPIGYAGGLNLYTYVNNSPQVGTDPLGLQNPKKPKGFPIGPGSNIYWEDGSGGKGAGGGGGGFLLGQGLTPEQLNSPLFNDDSSGGALAQIGGGGSGDGGGGGGGGGGGWNPTPWAVPGTENAPLFNDVSSPPASDNYGSPVTSAGGNPAMIVPPADDGPSMFDTSQEVNGIVIFKDVTPLQAEFMTWDSSGGTPPPTPADNLVGKTMIDYGFGAGPVPFD